MTADASVIGTGLTDQAVCALVLQRPLNGRCELCGKNRPTDPHHRLLAAHNGPTVPANLIAACRLCHQYWHEHPADAYARGVMVRDSAGSDAFRATPLILWDGAVVLLDDNFGYRYIKYAVS